MWNGLTHLPHVLQQWKWILASYDGTPNIRLSSRRTWSSLVDLLNLRHIQIPQEFKISPNGDEGCQIEEWMIHVHLICLLHSKHEGTNVINLSSKACHHIMKSLPRNPNVLYEDPNLSPSTYRKGRHADAIQYAHLLIGQKTKTKFT